MGDTGIPYLTKALNYVVGCDPVSDGCTNCWARRVATTRQRRLYGTDFFPRVFPERLKEMLTWRKPQRVGLSMMGDLFHQLVSDMDIERAFAYAALCQQHTFLVFTKRAKEAFHWYTDKVPLSTREECVAAAAAFHGNVVWDARGSDPANYYDVAGGLQGRSVANRRVWPGWPLPNVIPVLSICNQHDADEKLPWFVKIPAARRMVSLEPLLEEVDIRRWLRVCACGRRLCDCNATVECRILRCLRTGAERPNEPSIHGVIVGCESGPGRRPMQLDWVRAIRDQCLGAGVKFYFKQAEVGGRVVAHPELDGRTWVEFPEAKP